MKFISANRNKAFLLLISFLIIYIVIPIFLNDYEPKATVGLIMGGSYTQQDFEIEGELAVDQESIEKYFRPSDLPVLNDRFTWNFFNDYNDKKVSEITLPDYLLSSPEETILNYFSVLREAANRQEGKMAGCGSIGFEAAPYPVAYNFLSRSYQEKLPYEKFLNSFENILHTNLIKYREVPVYDNPSGIVRYFFEIETIEGSEKDATYFAYYYGFADMTNEAGLYKISNLDLHGENYLCAPMHGWSYDAKGLVEIPYGGWCNLVKKIYPEIENGYVKHIYFEGTDGYDYMIEFFHLTNDNDIEIAQYRKNSAGDWELIKLDPNDCLK